MEDDADGYFGPGSKSIPLTKLERLFEAYQEATVKSMVARNKYKTTIGKKNITRSNANAYNIATAIARTNYRSALQNLQATAQRLYTKATSDDDTFYQEQALLSMRESKDMLDQLNSAGLRRKRNKSRNKVYSAHKKSKRRRVKSTRRRHKKSTIHHRSKY